MSEHYRHFLTSVSEVQGYYTPSSEQLELPTGSGIPVPLRGNPFPDAHQTLEHLGSFPEPVFISSSRSSKARRKLGAGPGDGTDLVKHRRTRSGCFVCRSRRVKCDETHPVCERCKKGNRDCVYPDPPASKGPAFPGTSKEAALAAQQPGPRLSNNDEQGEHGRRAKLTTILDEDESAEPKSLNQALGIKQHLTPASGSQLIARQSSESSSCGLAESSSTRSASTAGNAMQPSELDASIRRSDWSHLPPDFQRHLDYFIANITSHHYSIANDGDDFFTIILPSMAVEHKPLLHAVAGFSAYHAMLKNPEGQLQDFLKYYNGGVTLLLECLKRKETNNVPVLVTILQLATMEEFLGDWVNLMGHQKAAFEIMTEIFEPETVMHTAVGRACLNWYSRYDSYVAIMGGFPMELPREWFDSMAEYNQSRAAASPTDLRWKIDHRSARLRCISYDMSMLYARGSRGQISPADFCREHERVTRMLHEWRRSWDPALEDPEYLVTDFGYRKPLDPGDIVDPYKPGILFEPPLFTTTLIAAEWHSIMIMHLSQAASMPLSQLYVKFGEHAYAACQYFASVESWPLKPKGSMVSLQPCISIAALFLPRDSKHQMWIRRKFACLDMLGCIHPTTRRIKMAKVFRDPSCAHWWLPNDEGLTPVLQSIRAFADERNAAAVDAQLDNIREVRHLFAKLEIGAQHGEAAEGRGGNG